MLSQVAVNMKIALLRIKTACGQSHIVTGSKSVCQCILVMTGNCLVVSVLSLRDALSDEKVGLS